MVRSPRSRGRGSRRWPGRPGGARKRKPVPAWQKRTQHRVRDVTAVPTPAVALPYRGEYRRDAAHNAYLLDQELGRLGVRYFAEYHGRRRRGGWFTVVV